MASLQFHGATREVTGSSYLLTTDNSTVLLECGMHQGSEATERLNRRDFPFKPAELDAVILSHSHLDHSGLLPKLVKDGFRGPIFMTEATHDLLAIMLKDAAFLEMKDIEWENKQRRRAGRDLLEPLYTEDDVERTLQQRETVAYHQPVKVTADIQLTFHDAGHILGSAIVELKVTENQHTRTVVFTGDLGNSHEPLLQDPDTLQQADVLLLESTYGDRNHRSHHDTIEEFRQALQDAAEAGGNVLIPAFAVGRTQEILFWLGKFYRQGILHQQQVFLDSPMAIAASEVYFRHLHLIRDEDAQLFRDTVQHHWQDWLPCLRYSRSTEESMQLNTISGGAIIIAGSGMCTGGRIRHHLKNNLWRNNTHVVIVGFQTQGTLGRALVDGAERVQILGREIAVRAQIHTLGGFSAHADQHQLLEWARHFNPAKTDLYLVHGELDKMLILQKQFHDQLHWYANVPSLREKIKF